MTEPLFRTTADGDWTSTDGGRTWLLTEPSQAWIDARQSDEPEPEPTALDLLAQMPPDQLRRVLELGVLLTEGEAIDTLTTAVAQDDPTAGVAVVAAAAEQAAEAAGA